MTSKYSLEDFGALWALLEDLNGGVQYEHCCSNTSNQSQALAAHAENLKHTSMCLSQPAKTALLDTSHEISKDSEQTLVYGLL